MKKILPIFLTALILSPLLAFVSCEDCDAETPSAVSYELAVAVDDAENKVSVDQTVTVTNTFAEKTDELVFAFYPDAFTLKTPPPIDSVMMSQAYPHGINAGSYAFLQAGGDDVKSVSLCASPCKIVAKLSSPLKRGQTAKVRFSFDLILPLCNARYGYNDFSINLTFFFPQLCRYDEKDGGFLFYGYEETGDPFAFDCADYRLTLDCPNDWQVACSADEITRDNGKRVYTGNSLRDLSLFLCPDAQVTEVTEDGYSVCIVHDGTRAQVAEYAANAFSLFSDSFCELPAKRQYLVFTPFMTAGAEYCNVAVLSDALSFADTEKTVVHEIAHQWWYSLVGSDQVSAPWQDEALAQWSTLLYFEKRGMKSYADALKKSWQDCCDDYVENMRSLGETPSLDVFRSTTDYRDPTDYFVTVYCKAALATALTADSLTTDGFCKALATYAENHALSFADADALFSSLDSYENGVGKLLKSALSVSPYRATVG